MHLYQTKPPHSQTCLCMGLIHLSSIKSTALVRFENSACSLELSPWGGTQKRFLPSSLNVFTVEILTKYYPLGLVYHGAISFRHKGGSKEYLNHSDLEGCLRSTCIQWNKKKCITSDTLDFSGMRLECQSLYSRENGRRERCEQHSLGHLPAKASQLPWSQHSSCLCLFVSMYCNEWWVSWMHLGTG